MSGITFTPINREKTETLNQKLELETTNFKAYIYRKDGEVVTVTVYNKAGHRIRDKIIESLCPANSRNPINLEKFTELKDLLREIEREVE